VIVLEELDDVGHAVPIERFGGVGGIAHGNYSIGDVWNGWGEKRVEGE
jgi:hypothetical protein